MTRGFGERGSVGGEPLLAALCVVSIAFAGCGGGSVGRRDAGGGGGDSGAVDSGGRGGDSGAVDSGGGGTDGGHIDAGGGDACAGLCTPDGGLVDSGGGSVDSGPPDAGIDAGGLMCRAGGQACGPDAGVCCSGLRCCVGLPSLGHCFGGPCPISDVWAKHQFEPIDPEQVLKRVCEIPITTWSYNADPGVRHMGPMAQDFRAAFGLGHDARHIHLIDEGGVALASIQALRARTDALARENQALQEDNAAMRVALDGLERRLDALEHRSGAPARGAR